MFDAVRDPLLVLLLSACLHVYYVRDPLIVSTLTVWLYTTGDRCVVWGLTVLLRLKERYDLGRLKQLTVDCTIGDRCVVWSLTVWLGLEEHDDVGSVMQYVLYAVCWTVWYQLNLWETALSIPLFILCFFVVCSLSVCFVSFRMWVAWVARVYIRVLGEDNTALCEWVGRRQHSFVWMGWTKTTQLCVSGFGEHNSYVRVGWTNITELCASGLDEHNRAMCEWVGRT